MIQEACLEITNLADQWELEREAKYGRRIRMRYIDQLLNRLEQLNLKDQREMPDYLHDRVVQLMDQTNLAKELRSRAVDNVPAAMEMLYEMQDSLMFNPYDEEL
ncbi:MAG: hypothetical protein ACYDAY_00620 [Candidatus Dormibacteria bacterium]